MQTAAPEAIDLSRESKITHDLYGTEDPKCKVFAKQCLTARRLLERGVRFIQIFAGKNVGGDGAVDDVPWDGHNNIETNHRECGLATDRPAAALLADLKAAGMLEDTPVIWGGGSSPRRWRRWFVPARNRRSIGGNHPRILSKSCTPVQASFYGIKTAQVGRLPPYRRGGELVNARSAALDS